MISPTPVIRWPLTGRTYSHGLGEDVAHLDELSVSWGRSRFAEHHAAQTARFGLIVTDPKRSDFATYDWIGQPVELSWTADLVTRTFFRGVITEVEIKPRPPHPRTRASRGCVLEFSATGPLTELGNRLSGVETWPDEAFSDRLNRIKAIAGTTVAGITFRDYHLPGPVSARSVNKTDALSLLKTMYDTAGGDRLAYDPQTNTIGHIGRRAVPPQPIGQRSRVGLYRDLEFGQGIAPRVIQPISKYPAIDGRWVEWDGDLPLTKTIEQRVTRVEYQWTEVGGASKTGVIYDPNAEKQRGIVALQVATEWRQGDWASVTARDWLDALWREGGRVQPPPLTYRADRAGGFPSIAHADLMISGTELGMNSTTGGSPSAVFVMASPWAPLKHAAVFGVIGGTIRYSSAGWRPTLNLQAVWHDDLSEYEPLKIRDLVIPGSPPDRFTIGELSRGVTFADLGLVGPRR